MAHSENYNWPELARRLGKEELKFYLRYLIGLPIVSGALTAAGAYFTGLRWVSIFNVAAAAFVIVLLVLLVFILRRLLALKRQFFALSSWSECTKITDLIGFEKRNKESEFMPSGILDRHNIGVLQVMGNGCSKWTMVPGDTKVINSFRQIRDGNGEIHFLASSPFHLLEEGEKSFKETGDRTKLKKARKNAISLLKLRYFASQSNSAGGTFEIRIYNHLATLRLIIINKKECIVGHYQEDGNADSLDTPLLIFHHNDENKWGFGSAFRRMFESEWHRAKKPTDRDWAEMKEIADLPE